MRKLIFIYTGGTIGMKRNAEGKLAPSTSEFYKELNCNAQIQEVIDRGNFDYDFTSLKEPIDSSNLRPENWKELWKLFARNFEDYDAFIIIHGTDTMAYSASMLSFILKGVSKPIVFTGAQYSIFEPNTDGVRNICSSIETCTHPIRLKGVFLCFGDFLMLGSRTTKISSTQTNAFFSPNLPPVAFISEDSKLEFKERYHWVESIEKFSTQELRPEKIPKVAVIKLYPGFSSSILDSFLTKKHKVKKTSIDALLIEGYGSGNCPDQDDQFEKSLKRLSDQGVVVCVARQPLHGTVNIGNYAAGGFFEKIGAHSCSDMTTEASVCKIIYILMNKERSKKFKSLILLPIGNEVSEQQIFEGNNRKLVLKHDLL